ncbi:carbohydrate ABC transporter substrate-binding protein (CUT1 family) [Motilibacter rhizosphaerae]|uniref:Carbohydrate ABC transporter substrate-binding protein (CUT1 family) n=1 Tax=Motilibacter rhizosphaerae TaxID=598652 RepID=A0A4Q7NG94_9ACTN|nr:sugar ABC transporter substrate-binding protein [Motilibacter rhizosphaerae]RZS82829.1 carbohydrate ABC transporter substrate-binding protein (CUT1 family) [Motilibacter rhizosphaerae]
MLFARGPRGSVAALSVLSVAVVPALAACGGAGGSGGSSGSGGGKVVNVLMVNNPQMVDLQKLTADNFTKSTGIKVNYTVLPENDVRDKISQEFSSQAGQYDVASLSNYEIPFYAKNGWLAPLDAVSKDATFAQDDILKPMTESLTVDGKVYGEPFYGESSFLMYRKDVLQSKGVSMPAQPTWQQVADIAAKVDGAQPGMKGICLRGLPGWGEVMAPLTTVVNTFGGTWFTKDWKAGLDSPEWAQATNFYVNLIKAHGESGASQSGFTECLNNMEQSKVAMWYDATSAAGTLESSQSPVAGKLGYAPAPVVKTKSSGWLYTWAWAVQKASKHQDAAAKFIEWASGKDYENLVGKSLGWPRVPAGKRASTYDNADYQKSAGAFYQQTKDSIASADPTDPGVQPRPTVGIQFVDIPEFSALGTTVSQSISSAIAGKTSVSAALKSGQSEAQKVADKYAGK